MENITLSTLESKRFNLNIHRGKIDDFSPKEIKKYIIDNNLDILILRLPSASKATHSKLINIGFDIINADSLVYYNVNLSEVKIKSQKNELRYELINKSNIQLLEKILPLIFEGYQNHYYSNPYLDRSKIIEGYMEWAKSFSQNIENKISWYVFKDNNIAGFATCSFNKDKNECEGVLYGVMPDYAGQGIYSDIIRFSQQYFQNQGFKVMLVSTQLQNYTVQKVWIREGFFLFNSFETYHINSLLNYSINAKKIFKLFVTNEILNEFAAFSGDKNRIHFDSEYAKKMGFKDRIAHGMITQSFLSKIFGIDYPGPGTQYLTNKNIFLSPIYLNKEYVIILSTLNITEKGLIQVLAKVTDENNNICLLSYNYLIKK